MRKKLSLVVVVAGLLACNLSEIQAAQITGRIDFGVGTVTYDTNSLATATEIPANDWSDVHVTLAEGDFATFQVNPPGFTGDSVTVTTPWVFNTGTPGSPLPGPAVNPLWSVDGFMFDLASSMVDSQDASFLNITGPGTITGHGFDATPGIWSFTSTLSGGGTATQFTFTTDTVAVPEPGTLSFLGLGSLATFGSLMFRYRSKSRRRDLSSSPVLH